MANSSSLPEIAIVVGCGYVGSRVAALWNKRGMKVFVVTRSEAKSQQLSATGFVPIVADISNSDVMLLLPDCDVLLWSVGFDHASGVKRESVWIEGLERVLNALPTRTSPRRILYTSSSSVYGDGKGQTVDETTAPNPATEGGEACLAAEQLLQRYSGQQKTFVSILRLAGIYGPERLLRRMSDLKNAVPITSSPEGWLNLIHVDDAVRAIDAVSRHESPPPLLNVVAANSVSRRTYYESLASLADAPPPVFEQAHPAAQSAKSRGGSNRRVVSCVRPLLDLKFEYDSIADGLRNAIQ